MISHDQICKNHVTCCYDYDIKKHTSGLNIAVRLPVLDGSVIVVYILSNKDLHSLSNYNTIFVNGANRYVPYFDMSVWMKRDCGVI